MYVCILISHLRYSPAHPKVRKKTIVRVRQTREMDRPILLIICKILSFC